MSTTGTPARDPMPSAATGLFDALTRHGFRPTANGHLGVHHGVPLRVSKERSPTRNNAEVLRLSIGLAGPEAAAAAKDALARKDLTTKVHLVEVAHGGVVVDLPRKLAKGDDPQPGLDAIDAVVQRVTALPGAVATPAEGAQLTTVDGVPRWMTEADRQALERETEAAAAAYAAIEPNLVGGIVAGAVGAVVVAIVWALLLRFANLQWWGIAIGGGALIAFLAVRVGRRIVVPLQVGVVLLAVAGVMLGQILGAALIVQQFTGSLDVGLAIEVVTEDVGGTLFALAGAVVGAIVGLRAAAKPQFQRDIAVH